MRRRAAFLALLGFATTILNWWVMVGTERGQVLDQLALRGSEIGSHRIDDTASALLSIVSMPVAVGLVIAILVVGLWGPARRRAWWAAGVVVAINVSTQVLKYWILWRPDFGMSARVDGANTLPSGHTAMAASAAVALILVCGPAVRRPAAWIGAILTAAMGYSTLVNQWHRPSDVIAAITLAVGWAALGVAFGAWHWPDAEPRPWPAASVPAAQPRQVASRGASSAVGACGELGAGGAGSSDARNAKAAPAVSQLRSASRALSNRALGTRLRHDAVSIPWMLLTLGLISVALGVLLFVVAGLGLGDWSERSVSFLAYVAGSALTAGVSATGMAWLAGLSGPR